MLIGAFLGLKIVEQKTKLCINMGIHWGFSFQSTCLYAECITFLKMPGIANYEFEIYEVILSVEL